MEKKFKPIVIHITIPDDLLDGTLDLPTTSYTCAICGTLWMEDDTEKCPVCGSTHFTQDTQSYD